MLQMKIFLMSDYAKLDRVADVGLHVPGLTRLSRIFSPTLKKEASQKNIKALFGIADISYGTP
jgi:hypothetical protein